MAQASANAAHGSRRLGSFMITKYASFPTASQPIRSSIPESLINFVATGSKQDAALGFKRLVNSSYVEQREGDAKARFSKPLIPQDKDGRTTFVLDIRKTKEEIGTKDPNNHILEQARRPEGEEPATSLSEENPYWDPNLASCQNDLGGRFQLLKDALRIRTTNKASANDVNPAFKLNSRGLTTNRYISKQPLTNPAEMRLVRRIGVIRRVSSQRSGDGELQQRRTFSTSTQRPASSSVAPSTPEPITIDEFHRLADHYIDLLVSKLEELQEERRDVDCEYSAGVLNLEFPPAGTYVFNKQPPNKQIWLSSPISGPKRYDYVVTSPSPEASEESTGGDGAARSGVGVEGEEKKGDWVYLRDGTSLSELLKEELGIDMDDAV
ncbi:MAG: hypothetical protein Q9209_007347 [Squamulea sp. 1 TL-2023]